MKIILVQSEIEDAISNFISHRMSINDGMELTINLNATRGDEGFTATIDILPKMEPVIEMPSKAVRKNAKTVTAPQASKSVNDILDKAEAAMEPEAAEEVETHTGESLDPVYAAEEVQEDVAEAQPEPEPVPEVAQKPTTSIFGGMKRPVNS